MKWLLMPLLWLAALIVAGAVLYRLWRGHNVVLKGRWSPRFVRMVAVVLVILGVGLEKAKAAPAPNRGAADVPKAGPVSTEWPKDLTEKVVGMWLYHQREKGTWAQFKQGYIQLQTQPSKATAEDVTNVTLTMNGVPPVFQQVAVQDMEAFKEGKKVPLLAPDKVLAILDQLEQAGYWDHWAAAYLWRHTETTIGPKGDPKPLVDLYGRLHRHACLTNTLIQAQAQVKPFVANPRGWMSKLARPVERTEAVDWVKSGAAMMGAAKELYVKSDTGTWARDGLVVLGVNKNSPSVTLIRAGDRQEIKPGETLRLGRLDLIETPADKPLLLEHAWLGPIELPAGRLLTSRALADLLPDDAKAKVKQTVADALKGAVDPANRLEKALPFVEPALREALSQPTDLPGAPRLRLILSLFDDAVMPALAPVEIPKTLKGPREELEPLDREITPLRR